ncbi:MAG: type II secretion system protein [Sulfurovum sp.]|nr:type II secretion system protein [Sulfurovum sp.]
MMRAKMRNGIAMIELIFAIVVMGIVMMSAPTLISTATQSGLVAVQQEAIAASASELGMILTRDWDEAGTDETTESPILIVSNGDPELDMVLAPDGNSSGRRAGTPITSSRKSFSSVSSVERSASSVFVDIADVNNDDIDDFDGGIITLTGLRYALGDLADNTITIGTTVTYISDTPSAGSYNARILTLNNPFDNNVTGVTTNIKSITTQTTSTNLDTSIKLQAFSCNIGTYTLKTRSF